VFVLAPGPTDAIHGNRLAFTLAKPFFQISRDDLLGAIYWLGFVVLATSFLIALISLRSTCPDSFPKRRGEELKKPTQANPKVSGFNCIGVLVNGSWGDCPDYPLFDHPKISIFCRKLSYLWLAWFKSQLTEPASKEIAKYPRIADVSLREGQSFTSVQLLSGLYSVICRASSVLFGPRSFW
jgi:hypothetical protein